MTPYFATPQRQALLARELERWRGTPFRDRAGRESMPGVKADCIGLVGGVLHSLGAVADFEWPHYVINGGDAMLGVLLDTLNAVPTLQLAHFGSSCNGDCYVEPKSIAQPGDILVVSNGKITHACIFAGGVDVWHCWPCCGVMKGNIHDPLVRRCTRAIYRPMQA